MVAINFLKENSTRLSTQSPLAASSSICIEITKLSASGTEFRSLILRRREYKWSCCREITGSQCNCIGYRPEQADTPACCETYLVHRRREGFWSIFLDIKSPIILHYMEIKCYFGFWKSDSIRALVSLRLQFLFLRRNPNMGGHYCCCYRHQRTKIWSYSTYTSFQSLMFNSIELEL